MSKHLNEFGNLFKATCSYIAYVMALFQQMSN
jgi:hypothetical protein